MELILLLVVLGVAGAVAVVMSRRSKERELQRREDELAPVKKLAFEDITAFGVDLQELDYEMSGHDLDAGANADYQRALDTYESAKTAGRLHHRAGGHPAHHLDRRGRSVRHRVRARPGRGTAAPHPPAAVLLRPAPRTVGRRRPLRPAGRRRARRARVRPRRRARQRRRRAGHPQGDGRRAARPLLAGRPRLRAVRRRLLRCLRPHDVDVHGRDDVRRPRWRLRRWW